MHRNTWKERIALDAYADNIYHVTRYTFAARYTSDCNVLDIACGAGFGTRLLRKKSAVCVIGEGIEDAPVILALCKR